MNAGPSIPERNKQPGLCYAVTDGGVELPVIDVTHPAFAVAVTRPELDAITARTLQGFERGRWWPSFVLGLMARRSIVLRDVLAASGSYLPGMATYLQKLGPDNVGAAWGSPLDRKLLRLIGPVCMRLRLRDLAELLAADLVERLGDDPARPLHLLNIGGGTAIDSINGLIVAERRKPGILAGRRVVIHVLDPDAEGPAFGARALAALAADDGPLRGLDAALQHHDYDWTAPSRLAAITRPFAAGNPAVACCSEGGLFEYGSDADIVGNLSALQQLTPPDCIVVGTVLCDGVVGRAMVKYGRVALRLRDGPSFAALVESAGWRVARAIDEGDVYHVVSLVKA